MGYILGLFIIIGLIISPTGKNMVGDLLGQIKGKATQTLFPKTEREILIENLDNDYKSLDDFFSNSAPAILNSKTVPQKEKDAIKKAAEAFSSSKNLVTKLEEMAKEDKSLLKEVVEKVLNLNEPASPDPTHIPPQCRLECPTQ